MNIQAIVELDVFTDPKSFRGPAAIKVELNEAIVVFANVHRMHQFDSGLNVFIAEGVEINLLPQPKVFLLSWPIVIAAYNYFKDFHRTSQPAAISKSTVRNRIRRNSNHLVWTKFKLWIPWVELHYFLILQTPFFQHFDSASLGSFVSLRVTTVLGIDSERWKVFICFTAISNVILCCWKPPLSWKKMMRNCYFEVDTVPLGVVKKVRKNYYCRKKCKNCEKCAQNKLKKVTTLRRRYRTTDWTVACRYACANKYKHTSTHSDRLNKKISLNKNLQNFLLGCCWSTRGIIYRRMSFFWMLWITIKSFNWIRCGRETLIYLVYLVVSFDSSQFGWILISVNPKYR